MCPNRTTSFCTNVDSPEERQCDFSSVPPLEDELTKLVGFFDGTMDMVFKGMDDVEADLNRFIQIMDKADTYYPESFNWAFWVAAGCNLALATICLGLCLAVMLLYFGKPLADKFKWLRSYLMVPLFVLLVALGWIYSTSFVVLSVGATDACINSPDLTVATILDNLRGSFQSNILYEFLVYYVRGCPPDLVPDELNQRLVILSQLVPPVWGGLDAPVKGRVRAGRAALRPGSGDGGRPPPFEVRELVPTVPRNGPRRRLPGWHGRAGVGRLDAAGHRPVVDDHPNAPAGVLRAGRSLGWKWIGMLWLFRRRGQWEAG